MYAHKVIKDLIEEDVITNYSEDIISLIKSSTKYHFGDMLKDVYSIISPMIDKYEKETGRKFEIFKSQMEGIVSPFDSVWFEWAVKDNSEVPKFASLLVKSLSPTNPKKDLLSMYIFFFHGESKKWRFIPILSRTDMASRKLVVDWRFTDEYLATLTQEYRDYLEHANKYGLSCINLCLMFLNCRNVETHKRLPDEKLQKKRKKYGKLPIFSYHVLEIKDIRKKDIYPEDHTPTKMGKLRYHQMPARVVYYTAEKPLFGNPKLTGWYAFKSYWRGDPKKGTVIRDYERKEAING